MARVHPAVAIEHPAFVGFDFRGGLSISPEFAALLIGLSTYTAAFIGEIVRGGILAVDRGQTEAAAALGLSRGRTLRLVVLPQALRVIVPPTTSQFLNLVKNSSLAVAIGYPDLISITNTTLNQTGQAIEAIALVAMVYLAISLVISLVMNLYNPAAAMRGQELANRDRSDGPAVSRRLARADVSDRRQCDRHLGRRRMPRVPRPYAFVSWALVHAIWTVPAGASSAVCRAARGEGACWAVVDERFRFILFGAYPFDEQWRPALACLLFVALYRGAPFARAGGPRCSASGSRCRPARVALLRGGAGASPTSRAIWGGLPLTFLLVDGRVRRRVSAGGGARPRAALADAGDPRAQHRLHRAGSRRAADHVAVHGSRDVSAVRAAGLRCSTSCFAPRSRWCW